MANCSRSVRKVSALGTCGVPADVCDSKFIGVLTLFALVMLFMQISPRPGMKHFPRAGQVSTANNTATQHELQVRDVDASLEANSDMGRHVSPIKWAEAERSMEERAASSSLFSSRSEEFRLGNTTSADELVGYMRKFCASRPKVMPWKAGQFIGFSAFGQRMMCFRGRRIFAEFPAAFTGSRVAPEEPVPAVESKGEADDAAVGVTDAEEGDASQQLPSAATSTLTMPVIHGTMRWKQNRVTVKVDEFSRRVFQNYTGRVVVSDKLGIVSSAYLQAFHVHTNILIPLVAVLGTQCKARHGVNRDCPNIDMLLYRELPKGSRLVGGENFSAWMASALANGFVDVTRRIDGFEDERTTRCYCDGVLHNMADVITMKFSQRIAEGDQLRRESTLYIKRRLNRLLGFQPYGTYPIPATEYVPFGLWANDSAATKGPTVPRLLLFLRRKTRTLEGVPDILRMAQEAGFNVHVMFGEDESYEVQARAARYADVIMAVHGQAMTWIMMMDGVKASNCRTVIELQYFGAPLKGFNNVYEVMSADSCLRYYAVPAAGAKFIHSQCTETNKFCASWGAGILHTNTPTIHPAFHHQSVFPNHQRLGHVLHRVFGKLLECAPKNVPVPVTYFDLARSSIVKEIKKKKGKKR